VLPAPGQPESSNPTEEAGEIVFPSLFQALLSEPKS
jgi:hypothetical protein